MFLFLVGHITLDLGEEVFDLCLNSLFDHVPQLQTESRYSPGSHGGFHIVSGGSFLSTMEHMLVSLEHDRDALLFDDDAEESNHCIGLQHLDRDNVASICYFVLTVPDDGERREFTCR